MDLSFKHTSHLVVNVRLRASDIVSAKKISHVRVMREVERVGDIEVLMPISINSSLNLTTTVIPRICLKDALTMHSQSSVGARTSQISAASSLGHNYVSCSNTGSFSRALFGCNHPAMS